VKELFADQDNTLEFSDMNFDRNGKNVRNKRAGGEKVMETAVFLDSTAYNRFADYYKKIGRSFQRRDSKEPGSMFIFSVANWQTFRPQSTQNCPHKNYQKMAEIFAEFFKSAV
jgi:hypothetical protein